MLDQLLDLFEGDDRRDSRQRRGGIRGLLDRLGDDDSDDDDDRPHRRRSRSEDDDEWDDDDWDDQSRSRRRM